MTLHGFLSNCFIFFTRNGIRQIRERIVLRQIYHEAPDDVFELVLSLFSDSDDGMGGLNILRLVNKRLRRVVESCTTRLRSSKGSDGPDSLPTGLHARCKRIEDISCFSWNLTLLDGCPARLKRLHLDGENLTSLDPLSACILIEKIEIYRATRISDLSPLRACKNLTRLLIDGSQVTDLAPLSLLLLLEVLSVQKGIGLPSISDLSPLSSCSRLRELCLGGNKDIEDLLPLSHCKDLMELRIDRCTGIVDLTPLSSLSGLQKLFARGIDPSASFLTLATCAGLMELGCCPDPGAGAAADLDELRKERPGLIVYCD